MKSTYFKRKESVLRVMQEEPTAKKQRNFNWDRYIYFILLGIVLLSFMVYLANKFLFVRADGQVMFENIMIKLPDDCRIIQFHKEEGDSVAVGDSLFTYIEDEDLANTGGEGSMSVSSGEGVSWSEKEMYNLDKKISSNKSELEEFKELLGIKQKELPRIKNEVMLDALPHSRLESLRNEIAKLEADIHRLESENEELLKFKGKLYGYKNRGKVSRTKSFGSKDYSTDDKQVFYSPIPGFVNRIFFNDYEVALKTENILSIQRKEKIYIKAYFDPEDIGEFHEGDTLSINFPDGTKSRGYIKRFYFGTYTLPEEFQKRYEPTKRSIAADIYPANKEELAKWKVFNKLSVEIKKFRY